MCGSSSSQYQELVQACAAEHASEAANRVTKAQHLFSVYVHAPPNFEGNHLLVLPTDAVLPANTTLVELQLSLVELQFSPVRASCYRPAPGYPNDSLWASHLIKHRVPTL